MADIDWVFLDEAHVKKATNIYLQGRGRKPQFEIDHIELKGSNVLVLYLEMIPFKDLPKTENT